jgi:recombinational DNA repair protein (RecF pathway)
VIEWHDEGWLIGQKPLGENRLILDILSLEHGRCHGMVSRNRKSFLIGSRVDVLWKARLEEQIGYFQVHESAGYYVFDFYEDPLLLRILQMMCLISTQLIPVKLSDAYYFHLFSEKMKQMRERKKSPIWEYAEFEACLVQTLGYPLPGLFLFLQQNTSAKSGFSSLQKTGVLLKQNWSYLKKLHFFREEFLLFLESAQKNEERLR